MRVISPTSIILKGELLALDRGHLQKTRTSTRNTYLKKKEILVDL